MRFLWKFSIVQFFFVTSIATFTLLLIEFLEQKTLFSIESCAESDEFFENLTVFDAKIV